MAKRKPVGGSVVRAYLTSPAGQAALAAHQAAQEAKGRTFPKPLTQVGGRGRFGADQVTVFEKENRGQSYVAKTPETRRVTGTRERADGRKQTVTLVTSVPEIRAWAASPEGAAAGVSIGKRGRPSAEVIAAFVARPKP